MRHAPIDPQLFIANRRRLAARLPMDAIAVVNANDVLPTNADGTMLMAPNSDLFYLTGIEQEESILLLAPGAFNEGMREILFLREPSEHLKIWEGYKHSKEDAQKISGMKNVKWLSEFPGVFRSLMCEMDQVYLNDNEHARATAEVETRDSRFARDTMRRYPLHTYRRLAKFLHELRIEKSDYEIDLLREACAITKAGFLRVLKDLSGRFALRRIRQFTDRRIDIARRAGGNERLSQHALDEA